MDTYNLIKQGLSAATLRSKTISNNIANVNTAGYKAFKVVFEENYYDDGSIKLTTNNDKHLGGANKAGTISSVKDKNTSMNENGNNVDLDLEKVNQATNTLMYNALITRANGKISSMKSVIGGN
ncbi:MAG: flagellar basal body rod protein FlgB [Clostridium sp.]|nr:flagellar basal body rod protein FlgB [Clostridium sp.]